MGKYPVFTEIESEPTEIHTYYPSGSRENFISGCVPICEANVQQGELYLGIRNADQLHGIHVLVSVEAIIGPPPLQTNSLLNNSSANASTLAATHAFIGRWKDDNSSFDLKADGSMVLKFDDKPGWNSGTWVTQGDRLYMTVGVQSVTYRILSKTPNRFMYQEIKSGTVYTAQRFAE